MLRIYNTDCSLFKIHLYSPSFPPSLPITFPPSSSLSLSLPLLSSVHSLPPVSPLLPPSFLLPPYPPPPSLLSSHLLPPSSTLLYLPRLLVSSSLLGVVIGFSANDTLTGEASGVVDVTVQLFRGLLATRLDVEVFLISQETSDLAEGMFFMCKLVQTTVEC